jgi:hypothetical protein
MLNTVNMKRIASFNTGFYFAGAQLKVAFLL